MATDSGEYECRIMVRQTLAITHTLLVSQSFSVQVDPPFSCSCHTNRQAMPVEGVASVELRGAVTFGCTVLGEAAGQLVWSRDGGKFRDGSFSYTGQNIR